jgi:Arylsulfatase A and related enzymes
MKAIMLLFDSLNRRMLEPYGCGWTKTPNFKRLAEKAVVFDNSYAGSLPCIPARRELHTGRYNFLHRSWGPLEPFDDSAPEIMRRRGIYSHLITDHQHYWEDGGATYHNRYSSWEIVRGQEGDAWKASVADPAVPEHLGRAWRQDLVNRQYYPTEDLMPQTQVFDLGLEFLKKNGAQDNWFLHLESFDPHEPYYTTDDYRALYPDHYSGPLFDWPDYREVSETPEQVEHCRRQYAALLSQCDRNLGRLLDFMDERDMWRDTMLIVNTDHGFLLGEHGLWAKCVHPFFDETAHTPLFIWDPRAGKRGERRSSLVQTIDIAPTLLDLFGIEPARDMEGAALRDAIARDDPVREYALFGLHGAMVNITDGRYVYMRDSVSTNAPLYNYTLMPTHMRMLFTLEELSSMQRCPGFGFTKGSPVMRFEARDDASGDTSIKGRFGNRLYDLVEDPEQERPIEDTAIEARMIEKMIDLMRRNEAPSEQYERLGLPVDR